MGSTTTWKRNTHCIIIIRVHLNIASKTNNVNGRRTGDMHGETGTVPRTGGNGRPMNRVKLGDGPTGHRVVHFSLAKGDEPVLQTCTNAWVPSCLKKKEPENPQPSSAEDLQIEVITITTYNINSKSDNCNTSSPNCRITAVHAKYFISVVQLCS